MTTSAPAQFEMGDRVLHPTKPEWGPGLVVAAKTARQDGRPCQRLDVRFDQVGLKTISTAFVELQALTGDAPAHGLPDAPEADPRERLMKLAEAATDPFSTPVARLRGTLAQYRYTRDGSGLIAWATSQTGMTDPLTTFSRHELEDAFDLWRRQLDMHLVKVSREAKTVDPRDLTAILADLPAEARAALKRVNARR